MSQTNPTIPDVINELMFIAVARPEGLDVTVEYSGVSDCVHIKVMPIGFDYKVATTESYIAASLLSETVHLDVPNALAKLTAVKERLLGLLDIKRKVAA